MKLDGEVALVTGGSRGIGRACCIKLASAGAFVFVNYHSNKEAAETVCHEIESGGGKARAIPFDVANSEEVQNAIDPVLKETKKISILVNNAGITRDGLMLRYPISDWDRVVNTNLRGAFVVSQCVIRSMIRERKGAIIHISSVSGLSGNAGQSAYSAAKAGLIGLTKSMARELAPRNIRVNAVAPGYIETDMTHSLTEDQKKEILSTIPLKRVGTSDEVAHAVAYLASDASKYVTGQVLVIDGGMTM